MAIKPTDAGGWDGYHAAMRPEVPTEVVGPVDDRTLYIDNVWMKVA